MQKQRTFTRNKFAEHNYNYVNGPQTTKPPRTNTQSQLFFLRRRVQQPTSNSVNFNEYPRISQDQSESYPFFQQNKRINSKIEIDIKHLIIHLVIFHQMMKIIIIKIILNFIKTKDSTPTT